jgi:CrcB protein
MTLLSVLLGGLVGTGLRLGVDALLPHAADEFPLGTLLLNIAGAFALALLVARVWPTAPGWLRAGLGAGLLGSFTTFSAIALATVTLTAAGAGWLAALYVAASVVGGLAAALLGLLLGRRPEPIGADE